MKITTPPKISKFLYKDVVFQKSTNEKKLYLTFDDCSDIDLTYDVLDILSKNNVKATFFPIGEYLEYTKIHLSIEKYGHTIGNHSYSHLNGFRTSAEDYYDDVMKFHRIYETKIFRPPYGRITPKQLKLVQRQYQVIMWSIMSYDFDKSLRPEQCFDIIKKNAHQGSIIVFHTNTKARKNLYGALQATIKHFSEQGFSFETL